MPGTNEADSISVRLEELEQRTKRLRKDSRELKIVFVLLGAVFLMVTFSDFVLGRRFGIVTKGIIQTPRLVIADSEGNPRAELGASGSGDPLLVLRDAAGRPRLVATQSDGSVRLRLTDGRRRQAELYLDDGGEGALYFTERDGSSRVVLGSSGSGDAGLQLLGPAEQLRVALTACKAGDSGLLVFDQSGIVRLLAGVREDGSPLMNMLDEAQQARIMFGFSPQG